MIKSVEPFLKRLFNSTSTKVFTQSYERKASYTSLRLILCSEASHALVDICFSDNLLILTSMSQHLLYFRSLSFSLLIKLELYQSLHTQQQTKNSSLMDSYQSILQILEYWDCETFGPMARGYKIL